MSWPTRRRREGELGIGMVGYGAIAKAHTYGYRVAPLLHTLPRRPRLRILAGRDRHAVKRAAAAYGFEAWTTDWRAVVEHAEVDLVDVCTPPGAHAEVVSAAATAGKAILCEKPLAADYRAAQHAAAAVARAGVLAAMSFNYRRLPAIALMRRMIHEGAIGELRQLRASWLTDEMADPLTPFDWRFDRAIGGSTMADLGSHVIDLALWIAGPIADVAAHAGTFTPERSDPAGGSPVAVSVEQSSAALLRFASGAMGTLETSRACVRRPCDLRIEISGDEGTIAFDYARLNELWFGTAREDPALYGMRRIRAEHPEHPYAANWWPIGQGVGYGSSFVNQIADHLAVWPDGPWIPDLQDGLRAQAVVAAIERAAAERRWVALTEVAGPPP